MTRYLLLICLILSGCKTTSLYHERQLACSGFQENQGRSEQWKQECIKSDETFHDGYYTWMMGEPPEKICYISFLNYDDNNGIAALQVAKKRNINCTKLHASYAETLASGADISTLCRYWEKNWGNKTMQKRIQSEVKNRNADCSQIIAAEKQADAAYAQAEASRAQAAAAWQNVFNANKPTNTSCYTIGNQVHCNSY